MPNVALRKESVDRNTQQSFPDGNRSTSLSARRAWIEITLARVWASVTAVALRKESVDRNA